MTFLEWGAAVKRTVFTILIFSLLVGIPLMIADALQKNQSPFRVPERFAQLMVDLSTGDRTDELLLERNLEAPTAVELFIQSDSNRLKEVKLVSTGEILGLDGNTLDFQVERLTDTQATAATVLLAPGKYALYLTSHKQEGKLVIGYQETAADTKEFERLAKIHHGELDNPPAGYWEVYSADLNGLQVQEEIIYTLSLGSSQTIGISVYTSARQGTVSVDIVGSGSNWLGVVSTEHRICDQMELTLLPGEYQIKLTSQDADGQLYLYLKGYEEVR